MGGETVWQARHRVRRSGCFPGLCLSSSVRLLISCQFHLPGPRWRKMIALFKQTLGKQHWEEPPTTFWLYLIPAISYTTAAHLNNDLLERQWLKEPICDTRRGSSKIPWEVMGEKWGQKKQVSAGNERKGGKKRKQKAIYRKIKRNSKQMFLKQQSEHLSMGGKPCNFFLTFLFHWYRLRSEWW